MIQIFTKDYIIQKEALRAVDEFSASATKASKKIASSIRAVLLEFSQDIGNTKVIDKRILPYIAKEFLYSNCELYPFTCIDNTISISEFMRVAGMSELKFVPIEMIVTYRSKKKYPELVRFNDEMMFALKKKKQFNFIGQRTGGSPFVKKPRDMYYDKIIKLENKESNTVFYFGVW